MLLEGNGKLIVWNGSRNFCVCHNSLTKLMVSHDLLRSKVTNQIAFDQQDSKSFSIFERTIDRCCQKLVSKLETSEPITFT